MYRARREISSGRLGNAHRKFDSTRNFVWETRAWREISSGRLGNAHRKFDSTRNFVWETRKCISLILSSDVLSVSSSSDLGMVSSDGVLFTFTGLMEMHSIGDLEMLTGNSIHNTSVSSHHMSDAETWKCSQELAPYV